VVGKVQGEAFIDSGEVTLNEDPWQPGVNHAHLTGAGVGLDWSGPRGIVAKLQVAVPVGVTPELAGPRPSIQVWAQIAIGF
jgi:hemolysin activation/secretion protein